jgi:hypothetical protein
MVLVVLTVPRFLPLTEFPVLRLTRFGDSDLPQPGIGFSRWPASLPRLLARVSDSPVPRSWHLLPSHDCRQASPELPVRTGKCDACTPHR